MCQIAITIPNEVLYDTKQSMEQATANIRKIVALDYYVNGGVSLGYCAEIADMSKEDFIRYLAQHKVSIFHFDDLQEYMEELRNA